MDREKKKEKICEVTYLYNDNGTFVLFEHLMKKSLDQWVGEKTTQTISDHQENTDGPEADYSESEPLKAP